VKGYNIDTSDFVVNTEHNIRFNEPNHNHWGTFKKIDSALSLIAW
jgi:hypothetical protein